MNGDDGMPGIDRVGRRDERTAERALAAAAIVLIVLGMKLASPVLAPILLGAFFAVVSFPAVEALRRRGLPNWAAITITCVAVVVVVVILAAVMYSSLNQFKDELPTYQAETAERTSRIEGWLGDRGIDASGLLERPIFTGSSAAKAAAALAGSILDLLSSFALLLLLVVFFLVDARLFSSIAERQLGSSGNWTAVSSTVRDLQRFFIIKSVENAIISLGLVVLLIAFDVPLPWLWGVIGFFLSFIPNVGLILACIPPVLLAYATSGLGAAAAISVGVTIINQVGDNVILPIMAKRSLRMPLSVQFVAFIAWTWVLGPAGALLALPLTMLLRLLCSMSARTAWLGDWLGGAAASPADDEPTGAPVVAEPPHIAASDP